jgi:hypothetical protein
MLRTVVRLALAIVCAAALLVVPAGAEDLRGVLLEDETNLTTNSHAQDGSLVAVVGWKTDPSPTVSYPLIAVFSEQTGDEIWRDESGDDLQLHAVAIAQGRVCVAGVFSPYQPTPGNLYIRCYEAKDGTVRWTASFDPLPDPLGNLLNYHVDHSSLTLSGKALVVRIFSSKYFYGRGLTLLLDPDDGSAK